MNNPSVSLIIEQNNLSWKEFQMDPGLANYFEGPINGAKDSSKRVVESRPSTRECSFQQTEPPSPKQNSYYTNKE